MIEIIQLIIEKPSRGILIVICSCVVYTGVGLLEVREALAGMQVQLSDTELTEQRVYDIHNAIGRIETQLANLLPEK